MSRQFPADERFGLTAQVRRAAVSVPSNIAEGYGRGRQQDYVRFLRISRGSLYELYTQVTLAVQLTLTDADAAGRCSELTREVDRILCALIDAVDRSAPRGERG